MAENRHLDVVERSQIPLLSVVFGYGPMLPFAVGTLIVWLTSGTWHHQFVLLTCVWAASILAFLAGVRRGLSFRTPGGPTVAQIATMFCLFVLASGSLVALVERVWVVAVSLLLAGFAAIAILDPIAAARQEAPLFFARLRPPQIAIAVASLVGLLVAVALKGG